MKGFGITRNFWVALVTIIAISLLFTYYLLVYVKNRERLIYEKKFRELERMAENIKVFTDELVKRTEGYLTIEAKNYDNLFAKQQAKLNERDSIYTGYSSIDFRSSIEKLNKEIDSLGNALNQTNSISTNLIDEFDLIEKNWIRINLADSLKKTILKKINIEFFVIRIKDIDMAEDAIEREYETELTEGNTKTTDKTLSKTNKKKNKKAKIIFQNLHNEVRLQTFDSLLKEKNGLNWSGVQDITLGKIDYKLFNNWLTLAPGDDLLLCSLEKSDSIRSEATAVEPWIIINLISILLFLFLGMPLLKLLIMNEVERLQVINVLFTGVAIILGTALIMLFVNFTYHFFGFHYKEMDDDLSILSDSIKNNFLDETSQAYDQLKSLDGKMKWFYTKKSTIYNSALKNTLIEGQYIKNYKPYNQIFWINQKGQLPLVIESNEIDTLIQHLPVVDKRKYFQAAAKNNLWTIPKKGTNDKNLLYVDFIRSMLNGQYQTVVSTRLEHKEKGAIAIGLSTKTFSLQYAALPPGYHACIIDQKGEVKFHTTNERSLQENFLEEIDFEPEILAAIEGRIEQNTSITYDKKNYRAYIQPIDGMPLYLVTFYSFDYYKAPIVLSVWFAVGLILLLFLLLVIQLALLYGLTHLTSKLKIKWFFLTWLRPKKPIKYRYQYVQSIVGCFLVLCLFVTIFIYFPLAKETIVGILVMPLFLLAFHYKLYTSGDSAYKRWARPEKVNSFLGWSCVFVLF
ncbi:MAG: cache domain-containing protein, partial [bacterium]